VILQSSGNTLMTVTTTNPFTGEPIREWEQFSFGLIAPCH